VSDGERTYQLRALSTVTPAPITWLLPGRIPYGSITLLGGRPGQGKSQLALALAAMMTQVGVPVLLIGSEDGMADTVKPRLMAAGANTDLVHEFCVGQDGKEGIAILPHDAPLLEHALKATGAKLVVIDPIAGHLGEEINANSDQSVRSAMLPLAKVCQATGAAALVVMHPKKGRDGSPLDWFGGSVGFGGLARSALLFGSLREPKDAADADDLRYLVHVKANGARLAGTLECKVVGVEVPFGDRVIYTSRVVLGEPDFTIGAEDLA
jgi:hypothetical protein